MNFDDISKDFEWEMKQVNRIARKGANDLIHELRTFTMHGVAIEFIDILRDNLQSYSRSETSPRNDTIRRALEYMEQFIPGYTFNRKGSFTEQGARERTNADLKTTVESATSGIRLKASVEGRLADLEVGKTNWGSLKRWFTANRGELTKLMPKEMPAFYNKLDFLFKSNRDPTAPNGRPHVQKTADEIGEFLAEVIALEIEQAFGDDGVWSGR